MFRLSQSGEKGQEVGSEDRLPRKLYWLPPENGYRACHMWRVPRTEEVIDLHNDLGCPVNFFIL